MKKILSVFLCVCMIFAMQMPVGFATVLTPAEGDVYIEDDFQSYSGKMSGDKAAEWSVAAQTKKHDIITDGSNKYLRFVADSSLETGSTDYPYANKTITAAPGDEICISADAMLINSKAIQPYLYFQLRGVNGVVSANSKRVDILKISTGRLELAGTRLNTHMALSDKWFNYEIYIKIAEKGKPSEVCAIMYGEGFTDASGNAVTKENPFVFYKNEVNLDSLAIDENGKVILLFNNILPVVENENGYTALDNILCFKADGAFDTATDIKINGESLRGFNSSIFEYDTKISHDAESAHIEVVAAEGSKVVIENNDATEFPANAVVKVTNAIGITDTYKINIAKKRSATALEAEIEAAYGGADSIISMTYDDGIYDTALFLNEQFKKYDLRGSVMAVSEWIKPADYEKWTAITDDGYLDIQSHTATHMPLPSDSWAESSKEDYPDAINNNTAENYKKELIDSKATLESWAKNDVIGFAAAYNTLSDGAFEVVADTYYAARLGARGLNTLSPEDGFSAGNWYNLNMYRFLNDFKESGDATRVDAFNAKVDETIAGGKWLVTLCHGIRENNGDALPDEAEELFRHIAKAVERNDIWCATFGEAIKYIREKQNSVVYSDLINGNVNVEVVTDNTNIPAEIFNYPLTVKTQVPDDWSVAEYTVAGKQKEASVFTEDFLSWAYIDVLPNTTAVVTDGGTSNELSSIAINGIKIEGFDTEKYEYTINCDVADIPLDITAKTVSKDASVEISEATVTELPKTVLITVTDDNGTDKVYTLNLTRAPFTDSKLKSLKVNGVEVEGFSADTLSYSLELDEAVAYVKGEANNEYATVLVDKEAVDEFPANVNVTVTAEDGSETVYTVVITQKNGDEILLMDDLNAKTLGVKLSNKAADSTSFGTTTNMGDGGVKIIEDENTKNRYGQYYYTGTAAQQYLSLAAYTTPGLTGTIVVKGKAMVAALGRSHDIHVRTGGAADLRMVAELTSNGNIKAGSTTIGKYTVGEWVEYTIAVTEDTTLGKYNVKAWFSGNGIKDSNSNSVELLYGSGSIDNKSSLASTASGTDPRIVYRGVVTNDNVVYIDDMKIYKQGQFRIKSVNESVNLDKGEKLTVKVNHDMDVTAVTADSIIIAKEDGTKAQIEKIVPVSTTELEVILAESTQSGDYTVSFGDTFKNLAGATLSETAEVTVINIPADALILDDNFNTKTDGYYMSGVSGTVFNQTKTQPSAKYGAVFKDGAAKFFNITEDASSVKYSVCQVGLGSGNKQPLVVKGSVMIPATDTTSVAEVFLRAKNPETGSEDYSFTNIIYFYANCSIKVGNTSFGSYTKGKWVDYTCVLTEDVAGKKYIVNVYLSGEGLKDLNGNAVDSLYINTYSAYDNESLASTNSAYSIRLAYRANLKSSAGNTDITSDKHTIYMDNWKAYFLGEFKVSSVSETVDLTQTNKINVKTNHDIDVYNLDKTDVLVKAADGTLATVEAIEKIGMNEFNIVLADGAEKGIYTVDLSGVRDVESKALTETCAVVNIIRSVPLATVSVNGVNCVINAEIDGNTYDWNDSRTESFETGTQIKLVAVTSDNEKFMYWIDANTKRVVCENEEYSFIAGTNVDLSAVCAQENGCFISFVSANGTVIAASDAGEVKVPENPYLGGYNFAGWYIGNEIQNLTAGDIVKSVGRDLRYRAGFKKNDTKYTVTLVNANEESAQYIYNDKVCVTAKDRSSEGLVFNYWKKNGVVVSYNEKYSFYVSGNEEIEACYSESASEKPGIISIISRQIDDTRMGFFTEFDIPEKYTVIETGILMGTAAGLDIESAPIKATAVNKLNKGQFTVRKASLTAGDVYYARGYVIYSGEGKIYTIYSDEIAAEMK